MQKERENCYYCNARAALVVDGFPICTRCYTLEEQGKLKK